MKDRHLKSLTAIAAFLTAAQVLGQGPPEVLPPSVCEQLMAQHVDKQANPRAARLNLACRGNPVFDAPEAAAFTAPMPDRSAKSLGGSDINLVTGD